MSRPVSEVLACRLIVLVSRDSYVGATYLSGALLLVHFVILLL